MRPARYFCVMKLSNSRHNGINVHTYYSKKKGNIVEVAKLAQIYDNEKCKTISTYYVNGKKTTKEKNKKRIKRLGKFKSIKYYNYKDANKHLK